ncbi:MAG: isocitrate dehydrogenase (NADP(+)) [Nitrospinota bacterium]
MIRFDKLVPPREGTRIEVKDGKLAIPDDPIVPFITGDGIGADITPVMRSVLDGAVERAYGGKRRIVWFEVFAGEMAMGRYGELLPQDTLRAVRHYYFAIKGPLTTPVGGGYRSLNVALRQLNDLYACVRPVRWFEGVPSPVKAPQKLNVIIFRENTEDVYAGIEWARGTKEVRKVIEFLNKEMGCSIKGDSGIGIKPISVSGTNRIARKAMEHALAKGRKRVTFVHKGNIQKYTEGAFKDWGYAFVNKHYAEHVVTEEEFWKPPYEGNLPPGKVLVNDRIADNMLQQVLTRPDEYEVLVTPNLNGDYISDACAAQVGGLGMAPGANIGDYIHFFEATHGSAPKYTGKDMVNPSSLTLSGVMMLEYLGWQEAADLVTGALQRAIQQKTVTYDLHRQMEGATKVSCSEFGRRIVGNMG